MDSCKSEFTTCPATLPRGDDGIPLRYELCPSKDGMTAVALWEFRYKSCLKDQTARWNTIDKNFVYFCLQSTFKDCQADMYENDACETGFR